MVPGAGVEPACLAAGDFKSPVSTSFTTQASRTGQRKARERAREKLEAEVGIEPDPILWTSQGLLRAVLPLTPTVTPTPDQA